MLAYGWVLHAPGQLRTRQCLLLGQVHPEVRRRRVGRALLGWQAARGEKVLAGVDAAPDVPRMLRTYVEDHLTDRARLLGAAGFVARRSSATMARQLGGPLPPAPLPDDVRLLGLNRAAPERHEQVRRVHNEAVADHWGSEPIEPDDWWRATVEGPGARPDLSFVALDDAGEAVGYLIGGTYPQGARAPARAMLVQAMAAYGAAGLQRAGLAVDVENPRALELYTGLGHTERGRETSWVRDFVPGPQPPR